MIITLALDIMVAGSSPRQERMPNQGSKGDLGVCFLAPLLFINLCSTERRYLFAFVPGELRRRRDDHRRSRRRGFVADGQRRQRARHRHRQGRKLGHRFRKTSG